MPFCVNCGSEVGAQARVCPVCSYPVEQRPGETSQPEAQPGSSQTWPAPPPTSVPAGPNTDGQAIAAMVCGIGGIPLACGCWFISWVAAVIAIVLGIKAQRGIQASDEALGGLGMAKAGWITGIVGVLLAITFLVLVVVIGTQPPVDFSNFQRE